MIRQSLAAVLTLSAAIAIEASFAAAEAQTRRRAVDVTVSRPSFLRTPPVSLRGNEGAMRPDIVFSGSAATGSLSASGLPGQTAGMGPNGLLPDRFSAGPSFRVNWPWAGAFYRD